MSAAADAAGDSPLIEFGWICVGDARIDDAVRSAHALVQERLEQAFSAFSWSLPLLELPTRSLAVLDEPAERLYEAVQIRDARGWDFALLVTPRDLRAYYESYALAVPSRALAVAVLSTARLAARPGGGELAHPIAALALHLFGDLNGLWHRNDPSALMQPPAAPEDLDLDRGFDDEERARLRAALTDVADLRLEESREQPGRLRFYLRAGTERAAEIVGAVLQARPWEFPLRLSRLSTAAGSALFVLLITAEVWDLGTSRTGTSVAALSAAVLAGTTAFIVVRQKLILRRARARLTEQAVVMNVSATLVVAVGLATTWALLFATTFGLGLILFDDALVSRWAPAAVAPASLGARAVMAGLVAALGLLIGSLGASFEGQHYFRHVIYADEET